MAFRPWQKLEIKTPVNYVPPSYLLGVTYDGESGRALLKFYDVRTQKIHRYIDTTNHQPYLLTALSPELLGRMPRVIEHEELDRFERVEKYDSILDMQRTFTKVIMKSPLAVGGESRFSMRNIIPEDNPNGKVWESKIKYSLCYLYDRLLNVGLPYYTKNGKLTLFVNDEAEERADNIAKKVVEQFVGDTEPVKVWARLLEYPVPNFLRLILDIEVLSPSPKHMPNPREALYPVVAVGIRTSDGKRLMFMLRRDGVEVGSDEFDGTMIYCNTEKELILGVFDLLWKYPFVFTFNGDEFDFLYLYCRALFKLGVPKERIPIILKKRTCYLKYGFHIDLCKFFSNRSLKTYAFQNKYENNSLDSIGQGLIKMGKFKVDDFNTLSYSSLARYCFRDVDITYELTHYDDELVLKLILALSRISNMPIEDVIRASISRWIRSFMYFEHRKKGILIPNAEDVRNKGEIETKATIKGKKYKGAIVVRPKEGIHFGVVCVDFASLYPSIIKEHNLGYESVRCGHEECQKNGNYIPYTSHWVCKKNKALGSLLIGSLKDLRVAWYKKQSKKVKEKDLKSWYKVIEQAIKVILNASYGVFANDGFDIYCPPVSEGVTAYGRHAIEETIKKAQSEDVEILYGDTDSIFMKTPTKEQIETLVDWSKRKLKMDLEVDKNFRYVIFSNRKKNYLGVLEDGTLEIKGLTGKKRHIPSLIRDTFDLCKEELKKVETPEEFEKTKLVIRNIIKKLYLTLKRREWKDLKSLAYHMALSKKLEDYKKSNPQHVKAGRQLKDNGWDVRRGDIIDFIKTKGDPNVKPLALATDDDVDIKKYIEAMDSTFAQITEPMNMDLDSIKGIMKIEKWFPK